MKARILSAFVHRFILSTQNGTLYTVDVHRIFIVLMNLSVTWRPWLIEERGTSHQSQVPPWLLGTLQCETLAPGSLLERRQGRLQEPQQLSGPARRPSTFPALLSFKFCLDIQHLGLSWWQLHSKAPMLTAKETRPFLPKLNIRNKQFRFWSYLLPCSSLIGEGITNALTISMLWSWPMAREFSWVLNTHVHPNS